MTGTDTPAEPGALVDGPVVPASSLQVYREVGDLKRLRDARGPGSLADRAFVRSWRAVLADPSPGAVERVALRESAHALVAARLAGVDAAVLELAGLTRGERLDVLQRAFDAVTSSAQGALGGLGDVRAALEADPVDEDALPAAPEFVHALVRQPRAGATHPVRPRVVVEPPESHGDHCFVTAVYSAFVAPRFGVGRGEAFLVALAHHLPNGDLPDAGFGGEVLLGEHYQRVLAALEERSMAQLPGALATRLRELLPQRETTGTPIGRVFNTADVLDRVLQVHHHARAAAFTAAQALDDLDIVHPGPVQEFQLGVLAAAGIPVR
ncbi:HD domain-containing protein [Kineococcus arenarius]|uniref:HD domain-containing protein n=1 Tax=unclassified Kineococcus TaxID=2621656 RepID=UPI003D7E4DC3